MLIVFISVDVRHRGPSHPDGHQSLCICVCMGVHICTHPIVALMLNPKEVQSTLRCLPELKSSMSVCYKRVITDKTEKGTRVSVGKLALVARVFALILSVIGVSKTLFLLGQY